MNTGQAKCLDPDLCFGASLNDEFVENGGLRL
jgi:hypothetical protein